MCACSLLISLVFGQTNVLKPSEFRGRETSFLQKPISSARVSGICGYIPLLVSRKKKRGQNVQELVIVGYTCACVMRPCEGVDVCASM